MRQITPIVKHLLIINIIVFLGTYLLGNKDLFYSLLALFYPLNDNFMPWQVFTHMFMHGGFQHLLFNMLALWMFGTAVERVFGQRKFLIFYLSSGLGAVALTFLVYYVQVYPLISDLQSFGFSFDFIREASSLNIISDNMFRGEVLVSKLEPLMSDYRFSMSQLTEESFRMFFDLNVISNGSMVGASGAIMGVLVAFGMLNPNAELMMLFLPIPIKAKYFIPGIIALDLFSAFTGVSIFSPSNTAYIAHIGGAVTGFLLMYFWKKNQFDKYRWN
ncbi:MAG: rhomboid family intramembrane serine protease [Flavobacteriaceae bacterium]|nr:rhomboid family intramembrane serine protease [Flavobacteriaceae bacterium]